MIKKPSDTNYTNPKIDTDSLLSQDGLLRPGVNFKHQDEDFDLAVLRTTGTNVNYLTGEVIATAPVAKGDIVAFLPDGVNSLISATYAGTTFNSNRWVLRSLGDTDHNLHDIAYNFSTDEDSVRYVIVGNLDRDVLVSSDGVSWGEIDTGTSVIRNGIIWDTIGAQFISVGNNGTIETSPDGEVWTTRKVGGDGLSSVIVNNTASKYVAVGNNGVVFASNDSITWTEQTSDITQDINFVMHDDEHLIFIAVADSGVVIVSDDGGDWNESDPTGTDQNLYAATHDAIGIDASYAFGNNETVIKTDNEGFSWTLLSTTGLDTYSFRTSETGELLTVYGGLGGKITTSLDFQNFTDEDSPTTEDLVGSTYDGTNFFLVGNADALVVSNLNPELTQTLFTISGNQIIATEDFDSGTGMKFDGITFISRRN